MFRNVKGKSEIWKHKNSHEDFWGSHNEKTKQPQALVKTVFKWSETQKMFSNALSFMQKERILPFHFSFPITQISKNSTQKILKLLVSKWEWQKPNN